jgi:2-polyprenyl-3-methyl-5-hydroxy-6-metoxy-1,4-benzoquinol methylase
MMTAAPDTPEARSSELSVDDAAFDISDEADVRALLRAEEVHFWHRARNAFIRRKIAALGVRPGARVLELGCGAGCVSAELARAGYEVTGIDGHRSLLAVACTRAPRARFFCHDLRRGLPDVERGAFDVVGLFDVVEHLDDPVQALADALRFVKRSGYVVGTVPALMALWSSIDVHAGHKTRYSPSTLGATLGALHGASVLEIAPFFRSLVPLLWAQRRMIGKSDRADRSEHSAAAVHNMRVPAFPLNAALLAITTTEHALAPLLRDTPLPGASLWFALAGDGAPIRAG